MFVVASAESRTSGPLPIEFIDAASAAATSITMPTHQAGDLLIAFAARSSTLLPTIPAGWTTKISSTAGNYRNVLASMTAASSSEVSGTWTSAATLAIVVLRNATGLGGVVTGGSTATASVMNSGAVTFTDLDGSSQLLRFNMRGASTTATAFSPATPALVQRTAVASGTFRTDAFQSTAGITSTPLNQQRTPSASCNYTYTSVEVLGAI